MHTAAVHATSKADLLVLKSAYRDALDRVGEDDYEIIPLGDLEEMRSLAQDNEAVCVVCVDVRADRAIESVEQIRKIRADIAIVLVVDDTMSPRQYIKPSIMASSLIFSPIQREEAYYTFQELVASSYQKKHEDDEWFSFSAGGDTRLLAYHEILFFEAREKRVYVRTKYHEYAFYETLEHLESVLPKQFARCHKSFIVNTRFLQKLSLSKNSLWLDEDVEVPISRSYKAAFKTRKEAAR